MQGKMQDYVARANPYKRTQVVALADQLKGLNSYIFTDYRGASVTHMGEVRAELEKLGARYQVIKNRLAIRALKQVLDESLTLSAEHISELLRGPTALVSLQGDAHSTLQYFVSINAQSPISLKGAILDGLFHGKEEIEAMASLPARRILLGRLLGLLQGAVRQFPALLYQLVAAPLRTLQAIADENEATTSGSSATKENKKKK